MRNTGNMVWKVINVAEKNDAAKGISAFLSRRTCQRREGFSKYNKIYEFDYRLLGRDCKMVMTSVSGHLMNYEFTGSYKHWNSCHPSALFDAPLIKTVTENMTNIKRTLEKEVRGCHALVVWTDCDREGENIGFEIINVCRNIKPNLQIYRARFSEITERSVTNACMNLVAPDENVNNAVDARQELDLRIGAAFTRFQTLRLQKVFPQVLSQRLISYGSCQFPTLGFVVERYKARESFISEQFWKIEVTHEQDDAPVVGQPDEEDSGRQVAKFTWKRGRLFNELACSVLHANCVEPPVVATVTSVSSRPKSKWRPVALETVELEKLASRKLRMNAKLTMKTAEKLYTQGYISYPRTETNIFPKDINLSNLIEDQARSERWGEFADRILAEGGPHPRNGNKSDKAHPPIHPTKFTNSLSGDEAKLYEFIVRHFLACCYKDAQGHETTVDIELGGEKFSAQGLMIVARNYLDVYYYDKWNAKVIPVYRVGDEFEATSVDMIGGQTSAPPLLTEADLIALMDKHGIGTDATHAEHIETIKNRLYVGLTPDQRFTPGELGMGLVEGYNLIGYEMSRPHLRSELESDLTKICDGLTTKEQVLELHVNKYRRVFDQAVEKATKLDEALSAYFGQAEAYEEMVVPQTTPVRPCPSCGADMVLKRTKTGSFMISCMGFPACRNVAFLSATAVQDATVEQDTTCPHCRPGPVRLLKLKLNRNQIPPYIQPNQVACVGGCDDDLNNVLNIRFRSSTTGGDQQTTTTTPTPQPRRRQQPTTTAPSSGDGTPGFLGGRGRARGGGGGSRGGSKRRATSSSSSSRPPSSGGGGVPTCSCGSEAIELTVRKEGANKGRSFYKCANRSASCNFFQWADDVSTTSAVTSSSSSSSGYSSMGSGSNGSGSNNSNKRPRNRGSSSSSTATARCRCNEPVVERTVQKEGANQGRVFVTCAKPYGQQCGFFEWADEGASTASSSSSRQPTTTIRSSQQQSTRTRQRKPPTCGVCGNVGHTRRTCPNNR